jgi:hypothetical protein
MTKVEKLKALIGKAMSRLSAHEVKFFTTKLSDNTSVQCTGDLEKGSVLNSVDDGGNASPLPDGEYKFADGGGCIIMNGVVDSFTAPAAPIEQEPKQQAQAAQKEDDGDVKYADSGLQADKEKRYPIDTEEHIRAAWNYINKKENASQYSDTDLKTVKDNIVAAWKEKIDPKGPPSDIKNEDMDSDTSTDSTSDSSSDDSSSNTSDQPVSSDDVAAAIAQALAPIIAQLQSIQDALSGAVNSTTECAKEAKAATEMSKQTQIALKEIGEVVEILADEPSVKKVEASNVNPFRDSESFLLRTAHLKK